jgi:hypothetical protein
MQIPGHARCLVDSGFGQAKKLFRRSDADSLADVATIFSTSSVTNETVLYQKDDGAHEWEWRAWKAFIGDNFKPFVGIRQYQHFEFDEARPGTIIARKGKQQPDEEFVILKRPDQQFVAEQRPPIVHPGGMSATRARYLYTHVRRYVRPC